MSHVELSVVIPAYNRIGPLRTTLRSVQRAIGSFRVEILLVDDGSTPSLAEQIASLPDLPLIHLRQENQGSIVARSTGLLAAKGDFVLFLDSDDLVPPHKFSVQLAALRAGNFDLVYGNMARASLAGDEDEPVFTPSETLAQATEPADFFLQIQPAPHNPIYRREYLIKHLSQPLVPPERRLDLAGDIWLYYNLCIFPAKIGRVDTPVAAVGMHEEDRYSRQWEKLGLSALSVMETFARRCEANAATLAARTQVGECAFNSWRRLPRHFNATYEARLLNLWRNAPKGSTARLGGKIFQLLASLLGAERAARMLRLRNPSYDRVRTLSAEEYQRVFSTAA